jgi:hypothetical protein
MSDILIVTLVEAEDGKTHAVDVTAADIDFDQGDFSGMDIDDLLMERLDDIRKTAAKKVAGTRVPYPGAGGSDSAYLEQIDNFADGLFFKDVRVANVDRRMYEVDAQYSPNSDYQPWTDNVEAGSVSEACFMARLELARNEGWDVASDIESSDGATKSTEELLDMLSDYEIFHAIPLADLAETKLRELVEAAEAGEDPSVIIEKLKTEGRRVIGGDPAPSAAPAPSV